MLTKFVCFFRDTLTQRSKHLHWPIVVNICVGNTGGCVVCHVCFPTVILLYLLCWKPLSVRRILSFIYFFIYYNSGLKGSIHLDIK